MSKERLISKSIKTVQMRRKKVASTSNYSYCCVVNVNVQLQVQLVKSRPFIDLPKYIPQCSRNSMWSGQKGERKQKLEYFNEDENQDIYSYYRLVPEP